MSTEQQRERDYDIYEAAMAGIPQGCWRRGCATAIQIALGASIETFEDAPIVALEPEMAPFSPFRVAVGVRKRVGGVCAALCANVAKVEPDPIDFSNPDFQEVRVVIH